MRGSDNCRILFVDKGFCGQKALCSSDQFDGKGAGILEERLFSQQEKTNRTKISSGVVVSWGVCFHRGVEGRSLQLKFGGTRKNKPVLSMTSYPSLHLFTCPQTTKM